MLCRDTPGLQDGFTLIELVVVVTLLAIVLFFAVPRMDSSLFRDDSRRFSAWMLTNVRELKDSAVKKQTELALHLDLDGNRIRKGPASADKKDTGGENRTQKADLPEGYSISEVEFPGPQRVTDGTARILFYPGGYSDQAVIRIRKDDGSMMSFEIQPFLPRASVTEEYD